MKYILLILLASCYQRIELRAESKRVGEMQDVFESCSCDVSVCPERHVLKTLECQVIHETYYSSWRSIKQYTTTFDDCHWDYYMIGPCR